MQLVLQPTPEEDILTQPEPTLTKTEAAEVKKVCRDLLEKLKREKLILDWREKQQARAAVMQTLSWGCVAGHSAYEAR